MERQTITLAAACLLLGLTGCGKGQATISGTVTFEGKPLKFGSVFMVGEDRESHSSEIGADGTYRIEKVPFGNARVVVSSIDPQENLVPAFPNNRPGALGPKLPPGRVNNEGWFPIPADYGDLNKSGLTLTVDQANKVFDIPLKAKGPG
jgi:hypothetical protein